MLTTQIQVLLYVGNIQLVSCSVFVPLPAIVVKSHQTLEALMPYLPLSLTASSSPLPDPAERAPHALLPSSSSSASSSSAQSNPLSHPNSNSNSQAPTHSRSSSSLVLAPRPSESSHNCQHHHNSISKRSTSNRISPDSSIPATTCIKISLQPTPTFNIVKPKCPHVYQKNSNRRHFQQQQQQQQQQEQSSYSSRSHPHSSTRSHSHHSHSRSHSHSHSHSHPHSHSHSHSRSHRRSNSSNMASIEYAQKTTSSTASSPRTISVKFTFPAPSNNPPDLVQVTGTFNGWQRTEPLNLTQDKTRFERKVSIDWDHLQGQEDTDKNVDKNDMKLKSKKILFKFVLDNNEWVTDPDQACERDQAGNLNNVFVLEEPSCQIGAISTDRSDTQEHEQRANESCVPMVSETAAGMEAEKKEEIDEQRVARLKQEEDDKVIRELGGGMWGTPYFAVNDPVDSSEHVVNSTVDKDEPMAEVEDSTTTMTMAPTKDKSQATIEAVDTNLHPVIVSESKADQKNEPEDEDDDDKVIRELGGGMWGTPYFAVNDPMDLSEHVADGIVDKDELMTEAEDALTTTEVETQITTVAADTIVHPVLVAEPKADQTNKADEKEENEDDKVIRELGGGMWGTPFFTVNDPAMLPEHFIEAIAASHPSAAIAIKSAAATKSEDAGIVQDTATTMDGPEDEADSLHVLTTSITPPQPGEGALVEQLPEMVVEPTVTSETAAPSQSAVRPVLAEVGDAKPLIDASINIVSSLTNSPSNSMVSTTSLPTNTIATSVNNSKVDINGNMDSDECKGDDEHHIVLLQNQSPVSPMSGDAKPTVDLSIATPPLTASAPVAVTTREALPGSESQKVSASISTVESSATDAEETNKSERRTSFWKKIKKVLA